MLLIGRLKKNVAKILIDYVELERKPGWPSTVLGGAVDIDILRGRLNRAMSDWEFDRAIRYIQKNSIGTVTDGSLHLLWHRADPLINKARANHRRTANLRRNARELFDLRSYNWEAIGAVAALLSLGLAAYAIFKE